MKEEEPLKKDVLQITCRKETVQVSIEYYFTSPVMKAVITSDDVQDMLSIINFSISIYGFNTPSVQGRILEIQSSCIKECIEAIVNADFGRIGSFHLVIGIFGRKENEKINCHSVVLTENDHPIPQISGIDDFETLLLADNGHYTIQDCRISDIEQFIRMTATYVIKKILS